MTHLLDPIKQAENYLEAHIPDPLTVRHAAATQGLLLSWGVHDGAQVAALIIPLIREYVVDDESLVHMVGLHSVKVARMAMKFGIDASHPPLHNRHKYFIRKLRKLFIAAYTDIDAVLLCAADHLARAVHIDDMTEPEYKRWAAETLAVDVPLLGMLSMWKERQGMADLALHLQDAGLQAEFEYYVDAYYRRHDKTYTDLRDRVLAALASSGVQGEVRMHEITPASLYMRYVRASKRGRRFSPSDPGILRIEVIVEREPECYYVMGLLHRIWMPSASTPIRDQIAAPRFNGYRALITTVNVADQTVEFRIMTHEMADVNARGVLTRKQIPNAWWSHTDFQACVDVGSTQPSKRTVCVFTPSGEVYRFKAGSTVMDFAFRVHSDLGPYARYFYINGEQVTYDTAMNHRDLVEIEFDLAHLSLQPEWEDAARSKIVKSNIRRLLRGKQPNIHRGRALLDEVLERESEIYNMHFSSDELEMQLDAAARAHKKRTKDEFYDEIVNGKIAPDKIVADIIEGELRLSVRVPDEISDKYQPTLKFARTWMQAQGKDKFDPRQRIRPGIEIVGRLKKRSDYYELVVHRAGTLHAPADDKAVPLQWAAGGGAREAIKVTVRGSARPHVMGAVMQEIQHVMGANENSDSIIHSFHADVENDMMHIVFTINTAAPAIIQQLEQRLSALRLNNLVKSYRIWELFPGQRKLIAGLSDRRRRNPYTPHYVSDNMFFGRGHELENILTAIRSGITFLILHGYKRIGKTSLMYHLAEQVLPNDDEANVVPVILDMLSVVPITPESFVRGLLGAAMKAVSHSLRREDRRKLQDIADAELSRDPLGTLVQWVEAAELYLGGRRLLFIVDEFTAIEEAYTNGDITDHFFQRMHHIVDSSRVAFMLCIHNHVLDNLTEKLGDMNQRAHHVSVDMLQKADAQALIQTPLDRFYTYEPGVVDEILRLTSLHPYYIHVLCSKLFAQMALRDETYITVGHLDEAKTEVLASASHHFAHYKDVLGELGRHALETIAKLSGHDNEKSASIDDIKHMMISHNAALTDAQVEWVVQSLYKVGAIQRSASAGQAEYRIRVVLLHLWSRMGTFALSHTGYSR